MIHSLDAIPNNNFSKEPIDKKQNVELVVSDVRSKKDDTLQALSFEEAQKYLADKENNSSNTPETADVLAQYDEVLIVLNKNNPDKKFINAIIDQIDTLRQRERENYLKNGDIHRTAIGLYAAREEYIREISMHEDFSGQKFFEVLRNETPKMDDSIVAAENRFEFYDKVSTDDAFLQGIAALNAADFSKNPEMKKLMRIYTEEFFNPALYDSIVNNLSTLKERAQQAGIETEIIFPFRSDSSQKETNLAWRCTPSELLENFQENPYFFFLVSRDNKWMTKEEFDAIEIFRKEILEGKHGGVLFPYKNEDQKKNRQK